MLKNIRSNDSAAEKEKKEKYAKENAEVQAQADKERKEKVEREEK